VVRSVGVQLDAVDAGPSGSLKVMRVVADGPGPIHRQPTMDHRVTRDDQSSKPRRPQPDPGQPGSGREPELLLPQGDRLVRYARLNNPGPAPFSWIKVDELRNLSSAGGRRVPGTIHLGSTPVAVSFPQTTFRGARAHGNFDALTRVTTRAGGGAHPRVRSPRQTVNQWNGHPCWSTANRSAAPDTAIGPPGTGQTCSAVRDRRPTSAMPSDRAASVPRPTANGTPSR